MIVEIKVFDSQLQNITTLASALGWKETGRRLGFNTMTFGGSCVPMHIITYECESNKKHVKSISLDILKSDRLIDYDIKK